MTCQILSRVSSGTVKLYSPVARFATSLRESMPSPSWSYFLKVCSMFFFFWRADALCTAEVFAERAVFVAPSQVFMQVLILCSNLATSAFVSFASPCTGAKPSLISRPFFRTKSVQALEAARAISPVFSTPSATFSTSSTLRSDSRVCNGEAVSFNFFAISSAETMRQVRSKMSIFVFATAARLTLRSSSLFSWSFLLEESICSTRALACSSPLSLSSRIRCFWVPALSNSWARTSSSSCFSRTKFSGTAERTFWMILRMASTDFCSCFRASSASLFFFSSSSLLFASSSLLLRASSACFCSSAFFFSSSSFFFRMASICRFCSSSCLLRSSPSTFLSCWPRWRRSFLPPPPPVYRPCTVKVMSTSPSNGTFQPVTGGAVAFSPWKAQTWSPPTFGPNHQPQKLAPSLSSQ
mmetsp:Transcript_17736/g.37991  ORF Transcript_17736/g.37991 Transcript_17736/m.37991 type:complete len:411 (-) Transcript_17736:58-1290(-)